jgi:Berberine and berberine like
MFAWPWERTADVLHAWREWVSGLPDELSTLARILQVPPLPDIPEPVRGRQLVVIEGAYLGAHGPAGELLRPLRDLRPELDTFAAVPPAALGRLHMDPEDPVPFAGSGQMLDELPPAAIDAIIEAAGPGSSSFLLSLELRQLGGVLTEPPPGAGALATLDQPFLTYGVGMIMDPRTASAINGQLEVVADALKPWDSGVRFANLVEVPIDVRMCYPPENLDRLQEVKSRYDPDDLFRANHPIPSPGGTATSQEVSGGADRPRGQVGERVRPPRRARGQGHRPAVWDAAEGGRPGGGIHHQMKTRVSWARFARVRDPQASPSHRRKESK